jgi:hypothetical protein
MKIWGVMAPPIGNTSVQVKINDSCLLPKYSFNVNL